MPAASASSGRKLRTLAQDTSSERSLRAQATSACHERSRRVPATSYRYDCSLRVIARRARYERSLRAIAASPRYEYSLRALDTTTGFHHELPKLAWNARLAGAVHGHAPATRHESTETDAAADADLRLDRLSAAPSSAASKGRRASRPLAHHLLARRPTRPVRPSVGPPAPRSATRPTGQHARGRLTGIEEAEGRKIGVNKKKAPKRRSASRPCENPAIPTFSQSNIIGSSCLTTEFGMGSGMARSLWSPGIRSGPARGIEMPRRRTGEG